MTDRIKVNAMDNDTTKWPSWTAQGAATTYAQAGVDTAEGARAVDAIKDAVHRTYRDEVRGDIGGFGGLFSINVAKIWLTLFWFLVLMALVPKFSLLNLRVSMTR